MYISVASSMTRKILISWVTSYRCVSLCSIATVNDFDADGPHSVLQPNHELPCKAVTYVQAWQCAYWYWQIYCLSVTVHQRSIWTCTRSHLCSYITSCMAADSSHLAQHCSHNVWCHPHIPFTFFPHSCWWHHLFLSKCLKLPCSSRYEHDWLVIQFFSPFSISPYSFLK